jgi:hypothetical protein
MQCCGGKRGGRRAGGRSRVGGAGGREVGVGGGRVGGGGQRAGGGILTGLSVLKQNRRNSFSR